MKAVIIDDEPIMIRSFCRYTDNIEDLEIIGQFEDSIEAYAFICANQVDVVFLDIEMPEQNGLELAKRIKAKKMGTLIVFVTAYDNYIKESNQLGADYYIVKPYTEQTMRNVVEKLNKLLPSKKKEDEIIIHTFGRFTVSHNGKPLPLVGKTKEILALIVSRCGNEISNEELYSTVWENRVYDNVHMKVYYNALKRLRDILAAGGISDLLISTSRGQMLNTTVCECDYYFWINGSKKYPFNNEFLSEYLWAESMLADMLNKSDFYE